MISQLVSGLIAYTVVTSIVATPAAVVEPAKTTPLAVRSFSLENRYPNKYVSDVFKDNILLTLSYMNGTSTEDKPIAWTAVKKPFHYTFSLQPDETFAFHDMVKPEYKDTLIKTTNAYFNGQQGFLSDGYLMGDGVCHLASLIYWAAKDAQLDAVSPVNHDFAAIPQVPKEYGVAVYYDPANTASSTSQNLYITNNKDYPVSFVFDYKDNTVTVTVNKLEEK